MELFIPEQSLSISRNTVSNALLFLYNNSDMLVSFYEVNEKVN